MYIMFTAIYKANQRNCILVFLRNWSTGKKLLISDRQVFSKEFEEVRIPVPWGHIAGKRWGPPNAAPFIGLHGWQDNAGTWDELMPLLPTDFSILALDSPGHGMSSHYSPGMSYNMGDVIFTVRRVIKYFGWDKISILGHSLGALQGFLYTCCYPNEVENFIAIDAFKPPSINPIKEIKRLSKDIDMFLNIEQLDPKNKPAYVYQEMIERLFKGMIENSVTKKSSEILLRRGIISAGDDKYQFTRDLRLRVGLFHGWTHEHLMEFAARINCRVLFIKALPGLRVEKEEYTQDLINILKKTTKEFVYEVVEGLHHVHLNNPERIAPIIQKFLYSNSDNFN